MNLSSTTPKILIAEDSPDLREALVEVLLDFDYNVKVAYDGYEAATMFAEFQPDLAILDMNMPMMNGADVCAVIRKTSDIPVIMFTSSDDASEVGDAISKGATDFVLKTTGMDELADRIEEHLAASTSEDQSGIDGDPMIDSIGDAPPANMHVSNTAPNAIKTFTVIIDPDETSRATIASILKRHNQDFIEVGSAGEGIAAIQDYDPDIVIAEWALPDMDSFKMFESLRYNRKLKNSTRIIVSEKLSPETQRKSNFIGITDFLEKPLDIGKTEILIGDSVKKALRKLRRTAQLAA